MPAFEFDYKSAWDDLAGPAFSALPEHLAELFRRVERECMGITQNKDLSLPWPEQAPDNHKPLAEAFGNLDTLDLAVLSCIAYRWGHWGYGGESRKTNGASWKVSKYADEIVASRMGVRTTSVSMVVGSVPFWVMNGVLMYTKREKDSWEHLVVGLASPTLVTACVRLHLRGGVGADLEREVRDFAHENRKKVMAEWAVLKGDPNAPTSSYCLACAGVLAYAGDLYSVSKQTMEWREKCRNAEMLEEPQPERPEPSDDASWVERFNERLAPDMKIIDVVPVNVRVDTSDLGIISAREKANEPHLFCIGTAHINAASKKGSMYIRPEDAPCSYCGFGAERHHHDKAVAIELSRNMTNGEVITHLKDSLGDDLEKAGFYGIVFVAGKYKLTED